ncbi:hypothetical protein BN1723_018175, partial [Verticillium longisporum]
ARPPRIRQGAARGLRWCRG